MRIKLMIEHLDEAMAVELANSFQEKPAKNIETYILNPLAAKLGIRDLGMLPRFNELGAKHPRYQELLDLGLPKGCIRGANPSRLWLQGSPDSIVWEERCVYYGRQWIESSEFDGIIAPHNAPYSGNTAFWIDKNTDPKIIKWASALSRRGVYRNAVTWQGGIMEAYNNAVLIDICGRPEQLMPGIIGRTVLQEVRLILEEMANDSEQSRYYPYFYNQLATVRFDQLEDLGLQGSYPGFTTLGMKDTGLLRTLVNWGPNYLNSIPPVVGEMLVPNPTISLNQGLVIEDFALTGLDVL